MGVSSYLVCSLMTSPQTKQRAHAFGDTERGFPLTQRTGKQHLPVAGLRALVGRTNMLGVDIAIVDVLRTPSENLLCAGCWRNGDTMAWCSARTLQSTGDPDSGGHTPDKKALTPKFAEISQKKWPAGICGDGGRGLHGPTRRDPDVRDDRDTGEVHLSGLFHGGFEDLGDLCGTLGRRLDQDLIVDRPDQDGARSPAMPEGDAPGHI